MLKAPIYTANLYKNNIQKCFDISFKKKKIKLTIEHLQLKKKISYQTCNDYIYYKYYSYKIFIMERELIRVK